jgi:hypothetical protein
MPDLVEKIVQLHEKLEASSIPHAFGGALALAWCTQRARGTIDIDINIFLPAEAFRLVISELPDGVKVTRKNRTDFKRDGQVRVWWGRTPLDLFLSTTEFHDGAAERVRWEDFAGSTIPFLSCPDLAVFKAFFNRTKDWADLEDMQAAGTLNADSVRYQLVSMLGQEDERILKLDTLVGA